MTAVTLPDVLREARPGRVRRIPTTPDQRRRLGRDGLEALDLLRHLLGARDAAGAPGDAPLTEQAVQALARRLGRRVGQKRARCVQTRLREAGIIVPAGSYPQRRGSRYRVRLWRLAGGAVDRVVPRPAQRKRPVGSSGRVKRSGAAGWWEHGLFGMAGRAPPGSTSGEGYAGMRSLDESRWGFRWSVGRDRSARLV